MFGIKKAVAFFAHSDDEMICAGTLHRLVREGSKVEIIAFSPAATEEDRLGGQKAALILHSEWSTSVRRLGVQGRFCPLSVGNSRDLADHGQEVCQYVYDYCEVEKPDLAIILSPHDENTAHAVVGRECERVMRGRVPHVWRCIFPCYYSGERPNLYVRLEEGDMEVKRNVINAYQSQKFRYDYETMLMAQVVADGQSIKCSAAEKFEIVRSVV